MKISLERYPVSHRDSKYPHIATALIACQKFLFYLEQSHNWNLPIGHHSTAGEETGWMSWSLMQRFPAWKKECSLAHRDQPYP